MASIDKRSNRPDKPWRARWREYAGGAQRTKHFERKVHAERFLVDVQHRLLTGAGLSHSGDSMFLLQTLTIGNVHRLTGLSQHCPNVTGKLR